MKVHTLMKEEVEVYQSRLNDISCKILKTYVSGVDFGAISRQQHNGQKKFYLKLVNINEKLSKS